MQMNFSLIAGILILFASQTIHGDKREYSFSLKDKLVSKEFLCSIFPKYVKGGCPQGLSPISLDSKINVQITSDEVTSSKISKLSDDKNCEMCKKYVEFYELIIDHSLTATFVQGKVLNDCQVFKSPLSDQCVAFYKGKGFEVIKALVNNDDSTKVCQIMNLCLKDEESSFPRQFLDLLNIFAAKQKSDVCDYCMNNIKFIEQVINNQKTALEIRNILRDSCQILNDGFKKHCIDFYTEHGVALFQSILNKEDPKKICQSLHLCPEKELKIVSPFLQKIMVNILQHSKDKNCEICKRFIKFYEFVINKNLNATFIQGKVLNVCQVYKSPLSDQCVAFYKGKGFEVIKAILNNEDPTKVCQILNMCMKDEESSFHHQFLELLEIFSSKKPSRRCKACIFSVKWSEKNINNQKSALEIRNILMESCEILNDRFKKHCTDFYTKYGVALFQSILNKEDPKKICQTIHFCHEKELKMDSSVLQNFISKVFQHFKDKNCEVCKRLVKYYEFIINKSLTATFIQGKLLNVCQVYKSPLSDQCVTFYKGKGLEIIKAILNNEDPTKVCQIINMCLKDDESSFHHQFLDLLEIFSSEKPSHRCKACILSVKWLENNINNQKSALEIRNILMESCEILNDKFKKGCTDFYTKYGVALFQSILNREDPKKICQTIHFCHEKELKVDSPVIQNLPSNIFEKFKDKKCEICKRRIKYYEFITNKSFNATFVQSKLLNVCQMYKSPLRDQCVAFYKGKGFEVIKDILNNEDPKKICQILNMCMKDEENSFPHQFLELLEIFSSEKPSRRCKVCIFGVKYLEDNINNQKSALEIRNLLMDVCEILNEKFKKDCTDFHMKYGVALFQSILNQEDPKKICQTIHFCHEKELKVDSPVLQKPLQNPIECYLCKEVMKELAKILKKNSTENEIRKALLKVCKALPHRLRHQCDNFINKYTNKIVELILKNIAINKICAMLQLCSDMVISDEILYYLPQIKYSKPKDLWWKGVRKFNI